MDSVILPFFSRVSRNKRWVAVIIISHEPPVNTCPRPLTLNRSRLEVSSHSNTNDDGNNINDNVTAIRIINDNSIIIIIIISLLSVLALIIFIVALTIELLNLLELMQ